MPPTNNPAPTTTIRAWGNSLGVRLPRQVLSQANLAEGTTVKIERTSKGILLSPEQKLKRKRKYTLRQLCQGMTPAKSHPEFDWGGPVGTEAI